MNPSTTSINDSVESLFSNQALASLASNRFSSGLLQDPSLNHLYTLNHSSFPLISDANIENFINPTTSTPTLAVSQSVPAIVNPLSITNSHVPNVDPVRLLSPCNIWSDSHSAFRQYTTPSTSEAAGNSCTSIEQIVDQVTPPSDNIHTNSVPFNTEANTAGIINALPWVSIRYGDVFHERGPHLENFLKRIKYEREEMERANGPLLANK